MIGHSLIGREVLQGFGANVFFEFITHYSQTVSLEVTLLLVGGLFYLAVSIFLNGGILGTFIQEGEGFSARVFFGSAGQYFGRFLRLFLFSLPFIIVAFLIDRGFGELFRWISNDSEPLNVIFQILRRLILLFLIFFINMVFDYAKIRTIFFERRDMFKTGLRSWAFVIQHLCKTLGLYYLVAIVGLLFFALYTFVGKFITASTSITIFLLFLWQQIYAMSRVGVRMLFYSAQVNLFKEYTEPYLKAWFKEDVT